jgi:hypothetical protein
MLNRKYQQVQKQMFPESVAQELRHSTRNTENLV